MICFSCEYVDHKNNPGEKSLKCVHSRGKPDEDMFEYYDAYNCPDWCPLKSDNTPKEQT